MVATYQISTLAAEGAAAVSNAVRLHPATLYMRPSLLLTLLRVVYLSAFQALTNQKLTKSCITRRSYFASAFGLHVSTISSITTELAQTNALEKRQLRPVNGHPSPCIYRIGEEILKTYNDAIGKILHRIKSLASRLFIVPKRYERNTYKKDKRTFSHKLKSVELEDIIKRAETAHPELV